MKKHYARICWNDRDWKRPAGVANDNANTFFGKFGFGFEEWLFDPNASIDGWQYGFLQPVNKGYNKRKGHQLFLRLYSIPGTGESRYREEFEISEVQVLQPAQANKALMKFEKSGRVEEMIRQVMEVNGDPSPLKKTSEHFENLFNIRFRMPSVLCLPPKKPEIRGDYYRLYEIPNSTERELPVTYPDEVPDRYEGEVKRVTINAYERDPKAREDCLKKWGFRCNVCKMSFVEQYGPIGEEFIHVHHLTPLSKRKGEYRINGAKDLRPVCPNCHAMLHRGENPPDIKELREYLRVNGMAN